MKYPCDLIRDLLPLYADDACSGESRKVVDEHLQECEACAGLLNRLQDNRIEDNLSIEKKDVIEYGERQFKKRTARVGSTLSGVFMIPILVLLIINLTTGGSMSWFFIVLAAMAVLASLVLVPVMVPENKLFWTFCAFVVSLQLLLGITCAVTGGSWFWIASSASLFGLGVIFLPFLIRAKPLKERIEKLGNLSKPMLVIGADLLLFLNMMTSISLTRNFRENGMTLLIGCAAGVGLAALEIMRRKNPKQ